jgi:hypothetical protein
MPKVLPDNAQITPAQYSGSCRQKDTTQWRRVARERSEGRMNRYVVMVVSVILALVVAAPMVLAQPNGGKPKDVDEKPIVLDSGAVFGKCDDPVSLEYSGKAKTLQLPGERFIFTSPELTATLTNVVSGVRETVVITGAFHQTTLENGDVVTEATGRNLLGDPEAGFVVAVGNFSYVFDAEGNLIQPLEGEGQLIDVCELLGAYKE